ncbi:MAG: hypothetical protein EZS28_029401, partial [Streblomastix strix]
PPINSPQRQLTTNYQHLSLSPQDLPNQYKENANLEILPLIPIGHQSALNSQNSTWEREDIALVLACDGLFDVLDNQLVAELTCPWAYDDRIEEDAFYLAHSNGQDTPDSNKDIANVTKGDLAELAALRLRSCADAMESTDNISLIVVIL